MNERKDHEEETVKAIQYVKSQFKDKAKILVARREDGMFVLKVETLHTSDIHLMVICEDTFLGLITSSMIYFEHYGLDLASKMDELIGENHLSYLFPNSEEEG